MKPQELKEFMLHKMRMSHIYQPVMIKKLLTKRGEATSKEIAEALLQYDPSQLEYYENITNNMVGKVLRNHKIVVKQKSSYQLEDFKLFSKSEVDELISLCEKKIDEYIKKRGDAIWSHRKMNRAPISGTLRYEVLKRAAFRCELCGISADEKALEVDHIVPKNTGGEDSIHNYQALCYSCNASKRDRDDTDFRNHKHMYDDRKSSCLFCNFKKDIYFLENSLAYAIQDKFPVTNLHTLIIPKRHSNDFFEITQPELNSVNELIHTTKLILEKKDPSIKGFNIGMNCGTTAGQTIIHTHIHVIPRRIGDIDDPTGGVRGVIPGKAKY